MRPLTPPMLLAVWDSAAALPAAGRALALVAAAYPEQSPEALARLSVGRRDACLLTLREWAFGPDMESLADCPRCGDRLELSFQLADIRVPQVSETEPPDTVSLSLGDGELRFRLPDSRDLEALAEAGEGIDGVSMLLGRCLLPDHDGRADRSPGLLPDAVVEDVAGRMAQADPQADVELALSCPSCEHAWLAPFDIASYFWSEVDAWANRALRDIHLLARAYGWREADVLALSPRRRQLYLELIGA
jgi:hypothetical protein